LKDAIKGKMTVEDTRNKLKRALTSLMKSKNKKEDPKIDEIKL